RFTRLPVVRPVAMAKRLALLFLVMLLGAAVVATDFAASVSGPGIAEAQPKRKKDRPGGFERLFGPREKAPPSRNVSPPRSSSPRSSSPIRRVVPSRKKSNPTRTTTRRSATTVPVVEIGAKDPNAR